MQEWDFAWEVAAHVVGLEPADLIEKSNPGGAVQSAKRGVFRFMQRMGMPVAEIAKWAGRDRSTVFHMLRRVDSQGLCPQGREVVLALSSEYRRRKLGTEEHRKQAKRIATALRVQKIRAEAKAAEKREAEAARLAEKTGTKPGSSQDFKAHLPLVVPDNMASVFWAGGCTIRRHPETGEIMWSQNNKHLARYMR